MDWLILSGAVSLGMVVGWVVYVTFTRQQKLDAKVLGAIISVMVGAGVLGIFQKIAGTTTGLPRELYSYRIGLLLGRIFTPIVGRSITHTKGGEQHGGIS